MTKLEKRWVKHWSGHLQVICIPLITPDTGQDMKKFGWVDREAFTRRELPVRWGDYIWNSIIIIGVTVQ